MPTSSLARLEAENAALKRLLRAAAARAEEAYDLANDAWAKAEDAKYAER